MRRCCHKLYLNLKPHMGEASADPASRTTIGPSRRCFLCERQTNTTQSIQECSIELQGSYYERLNSSHYKDCLIMYTWNKSHALLSLSYQYLWVLCVNYNLQSAGFIGLSV